MSEVGSTERVLVATLPITSYYNNYMNFYIVKNAVVIIEIGQNITFVTLHL